MKKVTTLLLSMAVFCLVSMESQAQVSFKYEYIGSSGFYLGKGDNPREKVGDAKGSAMVYQGSVNIPLSTKLNKNNKPIVWGVGLNGTYASLSNQNFTDDLVIPEIINIQLGIYHMRPLGRKWSMMASLGAGIYSATTDLAKIRAKQILGSGSIIFIHHFNDKFDLGGGIAVNSTFGYPMVFPAIYLNWNLHGRFDFMLSLANGLGVSAGYNLTNFLKVSLCGEMNGQTALLERDGKDVIFSHQYIVAGLRPEIKIGSKVSIPFTAGISACRPAYYSDRSLKAMFASHPDYYFQVAPYASVGLNVKF